MGEASSWHLQVPVIQCPFEVFTSAATANVFPATCEVLIPIATQYEAAPRQFSSELSQGRPEHSFH